MINWGNKGKLKLVCFKLLSRKPTAAPEQKDEKCGVQYWTEELLMLQSVLTVGIVSLIERKRPAET